VSQKRDFDCLQILAAGAVVHRAGGEVNKVASYSIRLDKKPDGRPDSDRSAGLEAVSVERGIGKLEQKVTQLFEQFRDSVYRYLMLVVESPAEAEELTQEAFLQLYRCLRDGQKIANVRAWMFRVAHNLALNHKAKRKYFVALEAASWDKLCQVYHDPAPDPERSVLQQEEFQRLRAAWQRLPPQQRQCLVLRAEGFRYKQIALILRISVSNVAQLLHRGIEGLTRLNHD